LGVLTIPIAFWIPVLCIDYFLTWPFEWVLFPLRFIFIEISFLWRTSGKVRLLTFTILVMNALLCFLCFKIFKDTYFPYATNCGVHFTIMRIMQEIIIQQDKQQITSLSQKINKVWSVGLSCYWSYI